MEEKPVEGTPDGVEKQPETNQSAQAGGISGNSTGNKVCPQCGMVNSPQSLYCYKCGLKLPDAEAQNKKICQGCKAPNSPTSQYCYKCGLKLSEQIAVSGVFTGKYGGFWMRLAAYLIDGVIIGIANFIVMAIIASAVFGSVAGYLDKLMSYSSPDYQFIGTMLGSFLLFYGLSCLASMVINAAYYTIAIGKWGKTIGKAALGLKVLNADGSRVSYARAFGRYWARLLNSFTLDIGYIVIAFTDKKQGIHDFICNTIVIKTN